MTTLTLKTMMLLGMISTPYGPGTGISSFVGAEHQFPFGGYLSGNITTRSNPHSLLAWNPKSVQWNVEGGYQLGDFKIGAGHTCLHGVDRAIGTAESYNYLSLEYKLVVGGR